MSVSVSNNVSVRGWRRRTTEEETEEADAEQKTRTPHRDVGKNIGLLLGKHPADQPQLA